MFLEPKFPAYLLNLFLFVLGGASVYLVILLYLAFNKQAARKITSIYLKLYKFFARKKDEKEEVPKRVNNALSNYYEGFAHFRKEPKHLVKPFLLRALAYLLNLTVYFFVFYALNIKSLSIGFLIVVYFITTAVQDASASFSVGSLDILLTTIFAFYGINSARSGVTAVTIRSTAFWFPLLVSFVSFQIVGARKALKSQKEELTKADKLQYN